jgi:hypothetical protein
VLDRQRPGEGDRLVALAEARLVHRRVYNEERPHSSLGYVAPAVFARKCVQADQAKTSSA